MAELFVAFYKGARNKPKRIYAEFKEEFEIFVASERERLGDKFEKRYPIDELKLVFRFAAQ